MLDSGKHWVQKDKLLFTGGGGGGVIHRVLGNEEFLGKNPLSLELSIGFWGNEALGLGELNIGIWGPTHWVQNYLFLGGGPTQLWGMKR